MANKKFGVENDKRQFFRVDDISLLKHKVVDANESHEDNELAYEQRKKRLTIKAAFESMTREMHPIHKMIAASNGKVAQYLTMVNEKLDMLSDCLVRSEIEDMVEDGPQEINIGAGGVSFSSNTPVMVGTVLEMELVLLPENNVVFSLARVVTCAKNEEATRELNAYKIAVAFQDMNEDVRDLISRHVIKKEIAAMVLSQSDDRERSVI